MDKIKKYTKQIIAGILLIAGVIAVIFGKNLAIQLGVSCFCWGLSLAIMILVTKSKQEQDLIQFDNTAREILQDIALNGEESEYFQFYNIEIINNLRLKLTKKHKKQIISCCVFCTVLLIIAICAIV